MAVIKPTQSYPIDGNHNFLLVSWEGLQLNDTGEPFVLSQYSDRSVQINGTFGAGGSVDLEGSNDGSTYVQLTDNLGSGLSFTSSTLKQVMEIVGSVRPNVVSGDGTTSIDVHMLVRK